MNSGSFEEDILEKHGYPTAEALYESAMRHVNICEEFGFGDVVISVKSTDVKLMIEAYRLVAERTDYPLPSGGHGSWNDKNWNDQVICRNRDTARQGDWRHNPSVVDR